jgi:hypothetical protein
VLKQHAPQVGARQGSLRHRPFDPGQRTSGSNREQLTNQRVELADGDREDEYVEEIFGQLWAVPKPDKVRVPEPNRVGLFGLDQEGPSEEEEDPRRGLFPGESSAAD